MDGNRNASFMKFFSQMPMHSYSGSTDVCVFVSVCKCEWARVGWAGVGRGEGCGIDARAAPAPSL